MMERTFELISSESIVLNAMVKKNKPLLDAFPCVSQLQSPSTATAKSVPFSQFSSVPRPQRGRRDYHWNSPPADRLYFSNDGSEESFMWCYLLSRSSDIPAPRFPLQIRQNGIFLSRLQPKQRRRMPCLEMLPLDRLYFT